MLLNAMVIFPAFISTQHWCKQYTLYTARIMYLLWIHHHTVSCVQEHYIQTIGVGYSCVLFAWIVVSTSKAESYCPLPGLQSVCIPTWQVPLPFRWAYMRFNYHSIRVYLRLIPIFPDGGIIQEA